jgi:hypothetical protein
MQRVLYLCFAAGFVLLTAIHLDAQIGETPSQARAQEDFALAVARAHARTSLFAAGSTAVKIHATAVSHLAMHGVGNGTYDNRWVDSEHWQRTIQFPDFQQSEIRNDSGHSWISRSGDYMPIRIAQLLNFSVIHVPNSTGAARYTVSESTATSDHGESLTCFFATHPTPADSFPRQYRWCFDTASGLLVSQDLPLDMHVAYEHYIPFQGKQEFTQVHVKAGNLPVLDLEIRYAALDPHELDGLAPTPAMHRSASTASAPNPEEWQRGSMEFRYNPPMPAKTPDELKAKPVPLRFYLGADNQVLDAAVESAPTPDMAEAALQAVGKFTFAPAAVNGKPTRTSFYSSVWFQTVASNAANQLPTSDSARPASENIYRNEKLSLIFRYPAGFVSLPRGQLEDDQRRVAGSIHTYGIDPHAECNTLLFKAQNLDPGQTTPQVLSIGDLDPTCVFGLPDRKQLEITAADAAHGVVDHWIHPIVSKPRSYKSEGRTFAIVSASGIPRKSAIQTLNILVVVTMIRSHIVGWTVLGPGDSLAQTLRLSTLQIGTEKESPLLPQSENP